MLRAGRARDLSREAGDISEGDEIGVRGGSSEDFFRLRAMFSSTPPPAEKGSCMSGCSLQTLEPGCLGSDLQLFDPEQSMNSVSQHSHS